MDNGLEKREDLKIQVEILTKQDFKELVYKEGRLPDKRFLPPDEGGVFSDYLDLNEVISFDKSVVLFPVIKVNDLVVGVAKLEHSPYEENLAWVQFVAVDPQYQGRGYASKLIEKIFQYADENNLTLQISKYGKSGEGELKLKNSTKRLTNQYEVKVLDNNK